MNGRTARRLAARRWVRRNRPDAKTKLPAAVVRLVLTPMLYRDGDLTDCAYYQGRGKCSFHCWQEPVCITDTPRHGWPRERMAEGKWWR